MLLDFIHGQLEHGPKNAFSPTCSSIVAAFTRYSGADREQSQWHPLLPFIVLANFFESSWLADRSIWISSSSAAMSFFALPMLGRLNSTDRRSVLTSTIPAKAHTQSVAPSTAHGMERLLFSDAAASTGGPLVP